MLNKVGCLGFILPHKFFNAQYGEPLRKVIADGQHLAEVIHFGDKQVFASATTYTCLLFLEKQPKKEFCFEKIENIQAWQNDIRAQKTSIAREIMSAKRVSTSEWNFASGQNATLFEKLAAMPTKLEDVSDRIFQGLVTGADPVFIVTPKDRCFYFSEATQQEHKLERNLMHPLCKGSVNIRRYEVRETTKEILFPYKIVDGKAVLISAQELSNKYPNIWAYLQDNRVILESREHGKWKHERWYAFGRSQNLSEMEQKKLRNRSRGS